MRIPFSKEQITDRIKFDNPWWDCGAIETYYANMKEREYFKMFFPLVQQDKLKRAVVLMGPRRVGKTVMLFHTIQKLIDNGISPSSICYLSVETPIYNGISLDELLQYYFEISGNNRASKVYILFDEIQYLKDWEIHLKSLVDSYHASKFVVSGSAAAALKLKSNESGAGRFTDFILPPLTFHEYIYLRGLDGVFSGPKTGNFTIDLSSPQDAFSNENGLAQLNEYFIDYINYGGYPEVSLSNDARSEMGRYMRNDIIDKVLLRDLPQLYGIDDTQELNSLFTYIAYNSGGEMSLEGISQTSGVSKNTIKKYIEYLEAAFLIRVVHRIDQSGKKFKRANFFKIYLTNPSMHCALFGAVKADASFMGNLVETSIYAQWQHADADLYYARWDKGEVDMVMLNELLVPLWAAEIKWSNKCVIDHSELKNLWTFCQMHGLPESLITTYDYMGYKEITNIRYEYIPSSMYCYMVGRNIIYDKMKGQKEG
jgi:hypothetical protein